MFPITIGFFCVLGVVVSSPTDTHRIVGGHPIDITDAPHQISLVNGGRHSCGGSLISDSLVVTAAHCVMNSSPRNFRVRIGTNSSRTGGELIQVADIVWHPNFSFSKMDSDIAVLQLVHSVEFSSKVTPIELAAADDVVEVGSDTFVTGWGYLSEGQGIVSEILQEVAVPALSADACQTAYGQFYEITDTMLCAGVPEGGRDACQGDSGGPLVYNGKLAGVVSWGIGCARPRYPGVYAKVSALRNWIDETSAYFRAKSILRGPLFMDLAV